MIHISYILDSLTDQERIILFLYSISATLLGSIQSGCPIGAQTLAFLQYLLLSDFMYPNVPRLAAVTPELWGKKAWPTEAM